MGLISCVLEDGVGVLMNQIEDVRIGKRNSLRFFKAMVSVENQLMCGHSDKHSARQIASPAGVWRNEYL